MNTNRAERKLFGTDGIRGVANTWPMDSHAALLVGQAVATWFKRDNRRHKIVIGKDTRLSGYMLETALASGLVAHGLDVYLVGPLPTPGIAYITNGFRADAGVVISASHNSYQYNGIKLFDRHGAKLSDEAEFEIEQYILHPDRLKEHMAPPQRIGKAYRIDDAIGRYVVYLKTSFPREFSLDGVKMVVDCANGATYKVSPVVFRELGAEVFPIGISPNGMNINLGVGSTETALARQRVVEVGADIGIALDGDGDRVILIDENGEEVDGDVILAIVGTHMLQKQRLKHSTVVATVASNMGLDLTMRKFGGRVERTPVGDRYVAARMRELGCNFGGESSGHLLFLDHSTTGDGTLAALEVLRVMLETGKKLSELAKVMQRVPQVSRNLKIARKLPFEQMPEVGGLVEEIEKQLAGFGRVLLRYSGTENLVRILLEGENEDQLARHADRLAELLEKQLGVAA